MMWFEGALSVKAVMLAGRREVAKLAVDQRKRIRIRRIFSIRRIGWDSRRALAAGSDRSAGIRPHSRRDPCFGWGAGLSIRG